MDIHEILKILGRRWWLIALPALVALAYAGYGVLKNPPTGSYSVSVRFTAAQPPADGQEYQDTRYYPWLTSEYVINALTDWSKTGSFAEEVSRELSSTYHIEIPAGQVQASLAADNARSVMVLILNGGDSTQLEAMARAASSVLQERSGTYFPQLAAGHLKVIPLDEPVVVPVPPSLTARIDPVIRFGLGLVAGIVLAVIAHTFDPTVHDRTDVEKLGLPVLAEVPRSR
jgi:capsular polysaccharide biosynthesis protein